jgi:diguanylate cyclase
MRESVQALQEQVLASQREIDQLRADLTAHARGSHAVPADAGAEPARLRTAAARHAAPARHRGSTHCLIMIDIDHFKRVNDTHGHQVGDRVLEGLGTVLRSMPAEPGMACARYGGEEFAILLPSTSLNKAVQMAEAVRSAHARHPAAQPQHAGGGADRHRVGRRGRLAAGRGRQCLDRPAPTPRCIAARPAGATG